MPKAPINSREIFYDRMSDGNLRFLDWNLVGTELGAMVEGAGFDFSALNSSIVNTDVVDSGFSKISALDENKLYTLFGTGGQQYPKDFTFDTAPIAPMPHI